MKVKFIRSYGKPVKYEASKEYELSKEKLEEISDRFYIPVSVKKTRKTKKEETKNTAVEADEVEKKVEE